MKINLEGSNNDILKRLWQKYVPKDGQSEWVQPEMLRMIEKLRYEAQNNGNINWDYNFEYFINYLKEKLTGETEIDVQTIQQIEKDLNRLKDFTILSSPDFKLDKSPYVEDDLYNRLSDNLVEYCKINDELIPNEINNDLYR